MSVEDVQVIRGEDGAVVDGKLYEGLRPVDLALVERQWTPWRQDITRRLIEKGVDSRTWPQSLHWDWFAKLRYLQLLAVEVFAIDVAGEWQGVVMIENITHRCQLPSQADRHLVYVDYVETAPWNWPIPQLGLSRRYMGLGNVLMRRVVKRGFELGFKGRVGLNALPQAADFYSKRFRMTRIAASSPQELDYFELSEANALEIISEEA